MTPQPDDEPMNPWLQLARMRDEVTRLTRECADARMQVTNLRQQLLAVQWDHAGYCPVCFPGEAPYQHSETCALRAALEGHDADERSR